MKARKGQCQFTLPPYSKVLGVAWCDRKVKRDPNAFMLRLCELSADQFDREKRERGSSLGSPTFWIARGTLLEIHPPPKTSGRLTVLFTPPAREI